MSEATAIALYALTAYAKDLPRQNVTDSLETTTLAIRSQSQPPANRDNQSFSQIQTKGAAQPQTHVQNARSAASRAPDQPQPEPGRALANGQTSQQDQEQTGILSRALKFLAHWDCGPVSATIGILGFVTTTLIAYYGLKIAIWTATKDYIEHCQADLNIGLVSEACQNAAHQQLPPPPFYGFHNLSNSTMLRRGTWNGMLLVTSRSHLHKNNYILMYATLANVLCWIVLYFLWKHVARSHPAAHLVKSAWSSQDALGQFPRDEEARGSDSDAELQFPPLETPEELQARRIDHWLHGDMPGPRLRIKRQGPAGLESNPSLEPGATWQETLEEMCRKLHVHPPVYQIHSDRRGGRTAWSSTVMVDGQNISARYWYDGGHIQNSREDAAEKALDYLLGVKIDH